MDYIYSAGLLEVIDADTLDLQVDLGFSIRVDIRVRLLGIDAPEAHTDEGQLATEFVHEWVSRHCAYLDCVVRTQKDEEDSFGRYLARIYSSNMRMCLNDDLLTNNFATRYKKN